MINRKIFPASQTSVLMAPDRALPPPEVYSPVDCDFTDELEHVSVLRIPVTIQYWSQSGGFSDTSGLIENIETANKEEFVTVSSGVRIRLDHLYKLEIL